MMPPSPNFLSQRAPEGGAPAKMDRKFIKSLNEMLICFFLPALQEHADSEPEFLWHGRGSALAVRL